MLRSITSVRNVYIYALILALLSQSFLAFSSDLEICEEVKEINYNIDMFNYYPRMTKYKNDVLKQVTFDLKMSIFHSESLIACFKRDSDWYHNIGVNTISAIKKRHCKSRMESIKGLIRERFPIMRKNLSLIKPGFGQDSFNLSYDQITYYDEDKHHKGVYYTYILNEKNQRQYLYDSYIEKLITVNIEHPFNLFEDYNLFSKNIIAKLAPLTNEEIEVSIDQLNSDLNEFEEKYHKIKITSEAERIERNLQRAKYFHKRREDYRKQYEMAINNLRILPLVSNGSPDDKEIIRALEITRDNAYEVLEKIQKVKDITKSGNRMISYSNIVQFMGYVGSLERLIEYGTGDDLEEKTEQEKEFYCSVSKQLIKKNNGKEMEHLGRVMLIGISAMALCSKILPIKSLAGRLCQFASVLGLGGYFIYYDNSEYNKRIEENFASYEGNQLINNISELEMLQFAKVISWLTLPIGLELPTALKTIPKKTIKGLKLLKTHFQK